MNHKEAVQRIMNSYSVQQLLKTHSLREYGIWRIKGEDPNCDFGGHHHQPDLGLVEGFLDEVIDYAVELKSFWTWGAGGTIEPQNIKKIDSLSQKKDKLREEINSLKSELKVLEKELNDLEGE